MLDEVACDDWPGERERCGNRVHHAGPVTHTAVVCVRCVMDDVRDGGRWHANHSAGEGTEKDDESKCASDSIDCCPHGKEENRGDKHDNKVHMQSSELVAQPSR